MNAEEYLDHCARKGEEANFEGQFKDEADRAIEAKWIRHALLAIPDSNPQSPTQASMPALRTLRIRGAHIIGELDLKCCGSAYHPLPSLSLLDCYFEPTDKKLPSIDLSHAHLCSLDLTCSRLTYLRANGMHVEGSVDLSDLRPFNDGGFCWCNLAGVFINGHLLIDRVRLRAPPRETETQSSPFDEHHDFFELNCGVNLYMSEIAGSIMVRKSAHIDGGFLLDSARVKGDVRMDSLTVTPLYRGHAIAIAHTTIGGNLTFARSSPGDPMNCGGIIWLWHTTIGGSFEIMDARLHGLYEPDAKNTYSIALYAGFMTVCGSVTIANVESLGLMYLRGMDVGNYMDLNHVKVTNSPSQLPIWITTPGWMVGTPEVSGGSFALDLRGVRVATSLSLKQNELCGGVDLSGASCRTLDDDESGYAKATPIVIDGLTYERLEQLGSRIGEDFKSWRLARWLPVDIDHYVPQPFVQLAHVLAHHGDEAHARDVLVNKARLDAKRNWYINHQSTVPSDCSRQFLQKLRLGIRRVIYLFFLIPYGTCFDFGLSPGKALFTLVSAILFGWLGFSLLNDNNLMVVAQTPVAGYITNSLGGPKLVPATINTATSLPSSVHCGNDIRPLVYATDVFIPLVDLREESKCDVDAAENAHVSTGVVTACRFFKAVYALLGWVVTTLALLTFSGVMRHRLSQD